MTSLGTVDALTQSLSGTSRYGVVAAHTGLLSVVVDAGQTTNGSLQVFRPSIPNGTLSDSVVENGQWRIDLNVTQGQSIEFAIPGTGTRNVQVVNLLQQQGSQVNIFGTSSSDTFTIDLRNGFKAVAAGVTYQLDSSVTTVAIEGGMNNDSLSILGSTNAEKVEMRPSATSLISEALTLQANNVENVSLSEVVGRIERTCMLLQRMIDSIFGQTRPSLQGLAMHSQSIK